MRIHIHDWYMNGGWHCKNPLSHEPGELDAATVWHVLGIVRQHYVEDQIGICKCGWVGTDFRDHIEDVVFYSLRDIDPTI